MTNTNTLVSSLTSGKLYDKKMLLIIISMINSGMSLQEAINEQLDITFDEMLQDNPSLNRNKTYIEKSLREVGEFWRNRLVKS